MPEKIQYLYEKLEAGKDFIDSDIIAIPKYISDNLKYPFFDWFAIFYAKLYSKF